MISKRVQGFTESVIREMTRVSAQYGGSTSRRFPNFPPPRVLVEAAHRAIDGDFHQYAITWGRGTSGRRSRRSSSASTASLSIPSGR